MEQELYTLPVQLIPPVFSAVRVAQSLVFCVVFCRSLFFFFVSFLLFILQLTASVYPSGILNLSGSQTMALK